METDITIQLRPCGPDDAEALALVGQATFLETFAGLFEAQEILRHCAASHAALHYRAWLDDRRYQLWLAEATPGHAPVGYMVVGPADLPLPGAAADLQLKRIYILGKFQGGGVGKRLIAEALAHARDRKAARLLLGVYANNDAAIGFYERLGFTRIGLRSFNVGGKDYDDLMMGLSLAGTPAA